MIQVYSNLIFFYLAKIRAAMGKLPVAELMNVAQIGAAGVGRSMLFIFQIILIGFDEIRHNQHSLHSLVIMIQYQRKQPGRQGQLNNTSDQQNNAAKDQRKETKLIGHSIITDQITASQLIG